MENLISIYQSWLNEEDPMQQDCLWEDFVAAGKEVYGEEGFNQCIKFFVTFGGAELHDWVTDGSGEAVKF